MTSPDTSFGFTHESPANKSIEWYTPPWVFQALKLHFDLDPAYPEQEVPWIPVNKVYTVQDDGLSQPWDGLVYLNPPYGRETPKRLAKMHEHRNGIALLFARTDCRWFHQYVAKADAILFLQKRIWFVNGLGNTGRSGAGSGSMLVAWGPESVNALKNMPHHGFLVELHNSKK